uniref:SKP1 component dimerisation domain-containing protein n=1 Tax=Panagrolaimus sp. PS1159 TaxID=55785 RepID=A0AC35GI46_9BILA
MADSSSTPADIADAAAPEVPAQKMFLRSKINPEFQIEIGPSVINCFDMTQIQLERFVELHNHFPATATLADKDLEWTNNFFKQMPEADFKELCWKADYLDSQRFLEAAGDFVLSELENKEVPEIQKYLNIVDDYTPEERKAMEEHPLEFFTGVSIQQDEAEKAAQGGQDAPAAQ